jgi:S1-C subfamily serine protease
MDLKTLALTQLQDMDALAERIEGDPLHSVRSSLDARAVIVTDGLESLAETRREKLMLDGAGALRKLAAKGEAADLSADETVGLEAVVHAVGRPALLVFKSSFGDPPFGWQILEDNRTSIERTLPSVGRVEIHNGPQVTAWGTGFLVADGVVMTNRHVVNGLDDIDGYLFTLGTPRLDYLEEDGNPDHAELAIKSAKVHDAVDLALLRVEPLDGSPDPPKPLRLAGSAPQDGIDLYAAGYPVAPGGTPPEVLSAIFGNKFGVKRLQPGKLMKVEDGAPRLRHDASTLGGSSGSPIVDIERDLVVGLHFSGVYKKQNNAVALWRLTDDALLKQHGLTFH